MWSTDLPSDLIVYFIESATQDEIKEFVFTVVGIPRPEQGPSAFDLLPEISSLTLVSELDGHQAYAIDLWQNVSETARREVIERIRQSPIFYAVLESVAPAGITALPTPSR